MRLFHFSHDPAIARFEPRAVEVPSPRAEGREWLNGPLVWAIEEARQPMYLFPRDCPRILLWQRPESREEDLAPWRGERSQRIIAHIEWAWLARVLGGSICRYELPAAGFEDLGDAGMWVSRQAVEPLGREVIDDIPAALRAFDVELRVMPSLVPLRGVWDSSLHASGIRLRHAQGWEDA